MADKTNTNEFQRVKWNSGEGLYNLSLRFFFYKSWDASIALLDQNKCRHNIKHVWINNNSNTKYKQVELSWEIANVDTKICFEVWVTCSTLTPSCSIFFTISTKELHKGNNPYTWSGHKANEPLHKRWAQSQGTKPIHKASYLYTRGKAQSQNNEKGFTTLGDHKDQKQYLSQYKILDDRFCNEQLKLVRKQKFLKWRTKENTWENFLNNIEIENFKLEFFKTYFP